MELPTYRLLSIEDGRHVEEDVKSNPQSAVVWYF